MIEMGALDDDGNYYHIRTLPQSAVANCPHLIFMPEHYRDDNTCRCDDEHHVEMREWGYTWTGRKWE